MTANKLSKDKIKQLRQIGHGLKPVVAIGDKGLSESVVSELQRALNDHELIKVRVRAEDKTQNIAEICEQTGAALVQAIGHVALIYKAANKPDPKLSNLLR